MRLLSSSLAVALLAAMTATALAQPRVIGDLSDGALMGQVGSTADLQKQFATNTPLLADATVRLGLSQEDFSAVRRAVKNGGVRYVELPRHLDGMTGSHNGRAFAVHDVIIPAGVYGWEVDLQKPSETVRVYIPNRCGNISYVKVPKRQVIAAVAPYHRVAETPAPVVAAAPLPVETPAPSPTPQAVAESVAMLPVAPATVATAAHHFAIIPWILGMGVAGFIAGHGGGSTSHPPGASVQPTPIPVHTICPPGAAPKP